MKAHHAANPFVLMMDPQAVLNAVERSERLQRLQRRICRPLDKPVIPHALNDVDAYDQLVDDTDIEIADTAFPPLA